jgi:hypothetical protein
VRKRESQRLMETLPLELIQEFDLEIKELVYLASTNHFFYRHISKSSIKINKRLVVKTEHWEQILPWVCLLNNVVVKNISLITYFHRVHTLNLSFSQVQDVSALGKVHTLDLSGTQVQDVSVLRNVHTLDLSGTQVQDVSALGNVHTLNLSGTLVQDVSALGNVHTLNLSTSRMYIF